MIVTIPITQQMRAEALEHSKNIPLLNNSITQGKGTEAGSLGEVATKNFLNECYNSKASIVGKYDYDIYAEKKGVKIEVKTKRCTSRPQSHYECSVANFNTRQDCDFYVFTRVDKKNVYLLGFLSKKEFLNRSVQMVKGQKDSNLVNGEAFKFHADCRNVKISQLRTFTA